MKRDHRLASSKPCITSCITSCVASCVASCVTSCVASCVTSCVTSCVASFIVFCLATSGPAVAQSCALGSCASVTESPCWAITSQQCLATPGVPSFRAGPAIPAGVTEGVICDSCGLDDGDGVVDVSIGQETGLSFCITLEAGVKFSAGARVCGVGVGGEATASVTTRICVDTKRWREHHVECRCPAGRVVHCRTKAELIPITITVPVSYDLTTCYTWRSAIAQLCDRPANGMTSFTETIHCATLNKTAFDSNMRITAAFADGECVPLDTEPPLDWKPKG